MTSTSFLHYPEQMESRRRYDTIRQKSSLCEVMNKLPEFGNLQDKSFSEWYLQEHALFRFKERRPAVDSDKKR
jgi:hypothetical protein